MFEHPHDQAHDSLGLPLHALPIVRARWEQFTDDRVAQTTVRRNEMAWITLTDSNGSSVFVNHDNVLWFSASGEDRHAWLITTANESDRALSLHVKQSPSEVVALLRSAGQEIASVLA
jgi:hypothetical protein